MFTGCDSLDKVEEIIQIPKKLAEADKKVKQIEKKQAEMKKSLDYYKNKEKEATSYIDYLYIFIFVLVSLYIMKFIVTKSIKFINRG
ncbi:hypothetical protein MNB_SV-9-52 [hydrothermal vent metagenome]|uniref:Uncharacterized protein n=1 Tax=hydrothermal vent metagenome TaxID=652676 RepID=A0A1W1CFE3_9ZZZZ